MVSPEIRIMNYILKYRAY